jgi:putative ABC transport system substrate-binding protein
MIGRREFIAGFGGPAAWLAAARAQRLLPVVGFISGSLPDGYRPYVAGFRQGLKDEGFIEGQNVAIEFRWANNHPERLPELAADLVGRKLAVLFAGSGNAAVFAAKAAASAIPIVFANGLDPVATGVVASLNRPGGNITGVTYITGELMGKRMGLLRTLVPQAQSVGYLNYAAGRAVDPTNSTTAAVKADTLAAARTLGWEVIVAEVSSADEFGAAFARFAERQVGALIVGPSPLTTTNRSQLIVLSARYRIPTLYAIREFPQEGGLMSYGASIADSYRRAARYVGRILKGEKPADLPVERPTRLEFIINLKTAKTLDIALPPILLAIADEVIE